MKYKKLTDEQIVKALECCINECDCENCPYGNNDDCMANVEHILDFIHRLQAENEQLTEVLDKEYALRLKHQLAYESADAVLETQRHLIDLIKKDKAELEKQVDKLKTFIDFKTANVMCDKCKQQTVKDTVKEIFEAIFDECWVIKDENGNRIFVESIIKHIAKERYGVEVE